MSCRFCALAPPDCENYNGDFHLISAITSNQVEQYCTPKISQWGEIISRIALFSWNNSKVWPPLSANILSFGSYLEWQILWFPFDFCHNFKPGQACTPKISQQGEIISRIALFLWNNSKVWLPLSADILSFGSYLEWQIFRFTFNFCRNFKPGQAVLHHIPYFRE